MKQNVSLKKQIAALTAGITRKKLAIILLGTAISSFGMYNIHQQTNITEGGVLGMILLLNHWFGISPSLLTEDSCPGRFLKHCHVLLETAHSDLSSGSGRRGGRLCPALWSLFPCALAAGWRE